MPREARGVRKLCGLLANVFWWKTEKIECEIWRERRPRHGKDLATAPRGRSPIKMLRGGWRRPAEAKAPPEAPSSPARQQFTDLVNPLLDSVLEIVAGKSPDELAAMPPFPFPKELFPENTFPAGLRFAAHGLAELPPSMRLATRTLSVFARWRGVATLARRGRRASGRHRRNAHAQAPS